MKRGGTEPVTLVTGFPESQRARVAALFWEAFSGKLSRVLGPAEPAQRFIAAALQPSFAISALDGAGAVIGIAGIKTRQGGLLVGGAAELSRVYGRFGAVWRAALLDLTEHRLGEGQMLLDGLFVAAEHRRQGIGRQLLSAVIAEAGRRHCSELRLHVVDGNADARKLYAKAGFRTAGVRQLGLARFAFGFRQATIMVRKIG